MLLSVTRTLFLTALVALPPQARGQDSTKVDLTGTWLLNVVTDGGSGSPTLTLKQQGDSLTGRYSSQIFGELEVAGTVKGREFSVQLVATIEGQSFTMTYSGALQADKSIKGTVDLGGMGGGTFTGTRRPPD